MLLRSCASFLFIDNIAEHSPSKRKSRYAISQEPERPNNVIYQKIICWFVILTIIICLSVGIFKYTRDIILHHDYYVIISYFLLFFGLFFTSFAIKVVIINIILLFNMRKYMTNSQTYSTIPQELPDGFDKTSLPLVIIHIPIYKECFDNVIKPTIENVKLAIEHYKTFGGKCKLLISDDGYECIDDAEREKRLTYYVENNVHFVARPKQNRKGVFKKASNLNYTLNIGTHIHKYIQNNLPSKIAYIKVWEDNNSEYHAGGDIIIENDGNILFLILDADTRMDPDTITKTVPEFVVNNNLAYTQHMTMPFTNHNKDYFQKMVNFLYSG